MESGISVVDGGKDSDSMLPDTQSTNSPRKTLTSNILSRSRMIHSSLWLPPNILCMALLNKMAIETITSPWLLGTPQDVKGFISCGSVGAMPSWFGHSITLCLGI